MKNRKHIAILLALALALTGGVGCDLAKEDVTSEQTNSVTSDKNISSASSEQKTESKNEINTEKDTSSEQTDTESENNSEIQVESISLDITTLEMTIGETKTPIVTMEPSDAEDKSEIWTSSDEAIAIVDDNGSITAISVGSCTVTVQSAVNPSVSADVHVTVKKSGSESSVSSNTSSKSESKSNTSSKNEDKEVQVTGISLSFTEKTLTVGESVMPLVTMEPSNADDKSELWTSSNDSVASVDKYGNITANSEGSCIITVASACNPSVGANIHITVAAVEREITPTNPEQSTEEVYINGILIVNKTYSLPSDYNPGGLTSECSQHFELLRQAAAEDGINIYISSGFRSYELQKSLYNSYVDEYGQAYTDTFSARPGHSEHQTGLAIDCNTVNDSFIGTPEAIWLAEHCHEYGFIIRYPQGKESITGYKYEPWHIRYVGVDNAWAIYESGLTLEEYFGIPSVYNY